MQNSAADFNAHTWEMHASTAEEEYFTCNFCDDKFVNKRDLMNHKKKEHTQKVKSCWHFSSGLCPFGDQKCWFAHSSKENEIPILNEHTCSLCDKVFRSQGDLLHHRKRKHGSHVPSCEKFKDGLCIYGPENCWFVHNGQQTNIEENKTVVQRIFTMMEKMTERILLIETNKENSEKEKDEKNIKEKDENEKDKNERYTNEKDKNEKDEKSKDKNMKHKNVKHKKK